MGDAKNEIKKLAGGLRPDTVCLYASIRLCVDQSLLAGSNRLKEMFNREAKVIQRDLHDALRDAAGGVLLLFVDATEVVDTNLSLIVVHSKSGKLARPVSLSPAFCESCATADSEKGCFW